MGKADKVFNFESYNNSTLKNEKSERQTSETSARNTSRMPS